MVWRGAVAGAATAAVAGVIGAWVARWGAGQPCQAVAQCLGVAAVEAAVQLLAIAVTTVVAMAVLQVPGPLSTSVSSIALYVATVRVWFAADWASALLGALVCPAVVAGLTAGMPSWRRRLLAVVLVLLAFAVSPIF